MNLTEFAAKQPPRGNGRTCWVCSLAERAELEQAHADGVSPTVIARWLTTEKALDVNANAVRHRLYSHFNGGHVVQVPR